MRIYAVSEKRWNKRMQLATKPRSSITGNCNENNRAYADRFLNQILKNSEILILIK